MRLSSHRTFVVRLFAVAGAGFLVFLVGMLAVRFSLTLERAERAGAVDFELINRELSDAFLEERTLTSARFQRAAAALASKPDLSALVISWPDDVGYAFAVDRDLLEPPTGQPERLRERGLHAVFSAPFTGDVSATLSASYQLVARDQAFLLLRDALFLVLAFLLACAIALLLIMILAPLARRSAKAAAPWPDTDESYTAGVDHGPRWEAVAVETPGVANPGIGRFGLESQELFMERLDGELGRATAYDTELSLVLGVLTATHATTDDSSERLAALVHELAPTPDVAFQYGAAGFALILPETDLDNTLALMDDWRARAGGAGLTVAIGAADRCGRLIGSERLLLETERALGRAMARDGDHLVGFRVDPVRFRELQEAARA